MMGPTTGSPPPPPGCPATRSAPARSKGDAEPEGRGDLVETKGFVGDRGVADSGRRIHFPGIRVPGKGRTSYRYGSKVPAPRSPASAQHCYLYGSIAATW